MENYIEFCLINTENPWEFAYYEANNIFELEKSYNDFKNTYGADEIEIQGMSVSDRVAENLYSIFQMLQNKDYMELYEIVNIFEAVVNVEEVETVIENNTFSFISATTKENAFITYIEDLGYLADVPEYLQFYIDYKKLMRDFEIEGLIIHKVPKEDLYLLIH